MNSFTSDYNNSLNKNHENEKLTEQHIKEHSKKIDNKSSISSNPLEIKEESAKTSNEIKEIFNNKSSKISPSPLQIQKKITQSLNLNKKQGLIDKIFNRSSILVKEDDRGIYENLHFYEKKVENLKNEHNIFLKQLTDHGAYNLCEKAKELREEIKNLKISTNLPDPQSSDLNIKIDLLPRYEEKRSKLEKECNNIIEVSSKKIEEIKKSEPKGPLEVDKNEIANISRPLEEISTIANYIANSFNGLEAVNNLVQKKDEELKPVKISNEPNENPEEIVVSKRLNQDLARIHYDFNGAPISCNLETEKRPHNFVVAQKLQEAFGENLLWKLGPIMNQAVFGDLSAYFMKGITVENNLVQRPLGYGLSLPLNQKRIVNEIIENKKLSETEVNEIKNKLPQLAGLRIYLQEEKDGSLIMTVSEFKRFTCEHLTAKNNEEEKRFSELTKVFCEFSLEIKISKEEIERIRNIPKEEIEKIKHGNEQDQDPVKIKSVKTKPPIFVKGIDELLKLQNAEEQQRLLTNIEMYGEKVKKFEEEQKKLLEKNFSNRSNRKNFYTFLEQVKELKNEIKNLKTTTNNSNIFNLEKNCLSIIQKCRNIEQKFLDDDMYGNIHKSLDELTEIAKNIVHSFDGVPSVTSLLKEEGVSMTPIEVENELGEKLILPEQFNSDSPRMQLEFNGTPIVNRSEDQEINIDNKQKTPLNFLAAKTLQEKLGKNGHLKFWKLAPILNQSVFGDLCNVLSKGKFNVKGEEIIPPLRCGAFANCGVTFDRDPLYKEKFGNTIPSEEEKIKLDKQLDKIFQTRINLQVQKDDSLIITASTIVNFQEYKMEDQKKVFCKFSMDIKISKQELERLEKLENIEKKDVKPIEVESVITTSSDFVQGVDQLLELFEQETYLKDLEMIKKLEEDVKKLELENKKSENNIKEIQLKPNKTSLFSKFKTWWSSWSLKKWWSSWSWFKKKS